jgi:hypothetical protein
VAVVAGGPVPQTPRDFSLRAKLERIRLEGWERAEV